MCQKLIDGKAEDLVTIDLTGKTDIADYMIIASGRSSKHTSSLAEILARDLKIQGFDKKMSIEGTANGEWVLLDLGDIIVHIFKPEIRQLYNLEKMWSVPNTNNISI